MSSDDSISAGSSVAQPSVARPLVDAARAINASVKSSSGMVVVLGIATMVFGLLTMLVPFFVSASVAILVAILLIATGIARTVFAFTAESWGSGIFGFLFGALTLVGGLFLLARPLVGLEALTMGLIIFLFADGIFESIAAIKLRPVANWGWMLLSGLSAIVLGFLIAQEWPDSSLWAIGLLLGVRFLFSGSSILAIGIAGRFLADDVGQVLTPAR